MFESVLVLIALGILITLVVPWINLARINALKEENRRLHQILKRLDREVQNIPPPTADPASTQKVHSISETVSSKTTETPKNKPYRYTSSPSSSTETRAEPLSTSREPQTVRKESPSHSTAETAPSDENENTDWFGRLSVWVGGIALLMAGFFMIRYSIESGWMTPAVRLWLTTGFGVVFCASGLWVDRRVSIRSNRRIGQALGGAGVACLYFASYASVHLYGFLSNTSGFVAMIAITVLAVCLSLRLGVAIALMGLVGGFLTPFLMAGDSSSTILLLSYVFIVFLGAQALAFLRKSAILLVTSFAGAFGWTLVLLLSPFSSPSEFGNELLLFLFGIGLTNAAWSALAHRNPSDFFHSPFSRTARWIVWAGILPQGLWILWSVDFSTTSILLYSVIALGALTLGWIRESEFGWIALFAYGFLLLAGLVDRNPEFWPYFSWPVGMSIIFGIAAFLRSRKSDLPTLWLALSLLANSLCVLVCYLNREILHESPAPTPLIWLIAFLLSAGIALTQAEILRTRRASGSDEIGAFSVIAFFLAAIGVWIYVGDSYRSFWLAGLVLSANLLWSWRNRGLFEIAASGLIIAWVVSMSDPLSSTFQVFWEGAPFVSSSRSVVVPWINILSLIFGFVVFWTSLRQAQSSQHPEWKRTLQWFLGIMGALVITALCSRIESDAKSSVEAVQWDGGMLTSVFAAMSILFLTLRNRWHPGWILGGIGLGIIGLRVALIHLFAPGASGESFFWNALFWQFGVPTVAFLFGSWLSLRDGRSRRLEDFCLVATMVTGWAWATFLIQDYYGSRSLFSSVQTDSEMYAYSAAWLFLAVLYQSFGLWKNLRTLHIGSLTLLVVTVAKVFLVDTAALTGLFRVLSFFGLGLALLGIGFFYNKVVFARSRKPTSPLPESHD
ncbi:DUF2339 domain-containing protein [Puniceicoccus vermicola]|uniref:DUF2339 domain-containing protein n=1 Tax=Puniceicoccus vermicola TaxID=388746 RepID=A0A7X1B052_9BACT|nr:DUF2339 domain-containing protein [Puniceicoccus vermicola]MBC2603132.1 DUF2339 domain-containing protein [Puniceicoccus vermicola]